MSASYPRKWPYMSKLSRYVAVKPLFAVDTDFVCAHRHGLAKGHLTCTERPDCEGRSSRCEIIGQPSVFSKAEASSSSVSTEIQTPPFCSARHLVSTMLCSPVQEKPFTRGRIYAPASAAVTAFRNESDERMMSFSASTRRKKTSPPMKSHGQILSGTASVSNRCCNGGA